MVRIKLKNKKNKKKHTNVCMYYDIKMIFYIILHSVQNENNSGECQGRTYTTKI